jgi:plasmid stability protein
VKSIAVSVDDTTYGRARIAAAERSTSVSALVRDYLRSLAGSEETGTDATSALFAAMDRACDLRAEDRLTRDEAHVC